ncbi:MAG: hypothetical protein ABW161_09745 [Candidatus Thiodiazotropha sp.]
MSTIVNKSSTWSAPSLDPLPMFEWMDCFGEMQRINGVKSLTLDWLSVRWRTLSFNRKTVSVHCHQIRLMLMAISPPIV